MVAFFVADPHTVVRADGTHCKLSDPPSIASGERVPSAVVDPDPYKY
jgi:hypothetical protein